MSQAGSGSEPRSGLGLSADLARKLDPPMARPGLVPRTGLLAHIEASGPVPLVAIVAPAGYGKSTLLAQWAERRRPRSAWISCDDRDNDPAVLLACLTAALAGVGAVDAGQVRRLSQHGGVTAVPSLMEAIDPDVEPAAVALDHTEAITSRECRYVLTEFALRLPPGWQVAMASRHVLPLPMARLRLQARLLEIGTHELAMDPGEAAALLSGMGLGRSDRTATTLVERTEGWPLGLYFAGLALTMDTRSTTRVSSDPDGPVSGRVHPVRAVRADIRGGDVLPHQNLGPGADVRRTV